MPEENNIFRCSSCNKVIGKGIINDGRIELKCKCGVTTAIEAKPKQTSGVVTNGHSNGLILGSFSMQHISDTSERQDCR